MAFLNFWKSNAIEKFNTFQKMKPSGIKSSSIRALMRKFMLAVKEKKENVFYDGSKQITQFGIFGKPEFWSNEHIIWLFNRISFYKYKLFCRELDGKNQACCYGE